MADNTLNLIKGWLLKPDLQTGACIGDRNIVLASLVLWLAALFLSTCR